MKRMTLIAAALCLVMLTTVGAGVVAAKQTENPRQAGKSPIYFYDVSATDTHGKGKLQINVDKHTFEFNGQGFTPSAQIALRARAADSADLHVFATGKATPSGNLHIAGTWEKDLAAPATPNFSVSLSAGSMYGYIYYIPASDTRPPYYLFECGTTMYLVTFIGTPPSPGDFGTGVVGATWTTASGSDVLTFANKQFAVKLQYAHTTECAVRAWIEEGGEITYWLSGGIFTTQTQLLGLPDGTFAPFPSQTSIKLVILSSSNYGGYIVDEVIIYDPIQLGGAYTHESY